MSSSFQTLAGNSIDRYKPTSAREQQWLKILQGAADGKKFAEIAASMGTSEQCVKNAAKEMYAWLDAEGITHAVAIALRRGMVD